MPSKRKQSNSLISSDFLKLLNHFGLALVIAFTWCLLDSPQEVQAKSSKKLLIAKKQKKKRKKRRKKIDDPVVVVETNKGTFMIQVFEEEVPVTAANFLDLVKSGFYNGLTFHRYDPRFLIQGGDPTGTGTGGSGKTIPLEINNNLKHSEMGMVGLARKSDKNSGSSQFYIILSPRSELDGDYAVYGKVIEGLEIVFQLRKGDKMNKVFIEGEDGK